MSDAEKLLELARGVLDIEADAVRGLKGRLGKEFLAAHALIRATRGRVVVTGMGKSGHIGNKIAATLASTGTPAFFMHPAEASHGDLGMITKDDVVGARLCGQASRACGKASTTSAALARVERSSAVTAIRPMRCRRE